VTTRFMLYDTRGRRFVMPEWCWKKLEDAEDAKRRWGGRHIRVVVVEIKRIKD